MVFGRPDMIFVVDWALNNNYLSMVFGLIYIAALCNDSVMRRETVTQTDRQRERETM